MADNEQAPPAVEYTGCPDCEQPSYDAAADFCTNPDCPSNEIEEEYDDDLDDLDIDDE